MEAAAVAAQQGFRLGAGPLIKVLLFVLGHGQRPRLFITVHHLVVDGVSWRILLSDLETAYRQAAGGGEIDLGAKTTSFHDWARRLAGHAAAEGFDGELDYWTAGSTNAVVPIPVDGTGNNTIASAVTLSAELDAEQTRALLQKVPGIYRTQINDVLLSALGRVLSDWTGHDRIAIAMEGHGREDLFDDVDLSRTVGWFTSLFPVTLTIPPQPDWAVVIRSVRRQLRAIPGHGLSYGALRYLGGPGSSERLLAGTVRPEISFNYLGQFDTTITEDGLFGRGLPAIGESRDRKEKRHWLLDVAGSVSGGRLQFAWTYPAGIYREETVRRLADGVTEALRQIIGHRPTKT
jgi:non-ribosomal peptide synthase protein (TIGR01720 family)